MLGQRGDGELLLDTEDRALRSYGLPHQGAGQGRCVRLHRAVLQPVQETLKIELPQPGSIRGAAALKGLGKASGKSGEAQPFDALRMVFSELSSGRFSTGSGTLRWSRTARLNQQTEGRDNHDHAALTRRSPTAAHLHPIGAFQSTAGGDDLAASPYSALNGIRSKIAFSLRAIQRSQPLFP